VNVISGARRTLLKRATEKTSVYPDTLLSPAAHYCAAQLDGKHYLIDTRSGAETPLPISDVREWYWGTGDGDLIYETASGWRRLRFRVGG
jgi:hypothetical protein